MSIRDTLDIKAYLVIGPENTLGRPIGPIISAALEAGFTCVQIRSKVASARELIALCEEAAAVIAAQGKQDTVALLVDDRLDVVLACRARGIKVDGIHVGQSDIPVDVCRSYIGPDGIVGLSARAHEMLAYVQTADVSDVDYFGIGPLHETPTKPDCGLDEDGTVLVRTLEDIAELTRASIVPVVVGGGVKEADVPALARTGVQGFFVVSAVCGADDPKRAAHELVSAWEEARR